MAEIGTAVGSCAADVGEGTGEVGGGRRGRGAIWSCAADVGAGTVWEWKGTTENFRM